MNDFHDLYTKYASDIYRFSLFLCANKEEAEEITSETFARAITGKAPLVSDTVKGYLLTIARNLYLESIRRNKRVRKFRSALPEVFSNPEHEVGHKTDLEDVQVYLQTFPEIDRTALLLRADGMGYEEIAGSLNISLSSAKVKVHRLRLKLAEWRANRE